MSEKCAPDDPNRCQAVTQHGQCVYLAVEGSQYCNFHGVGSGKRHLEQKERERYLIDQHTLRSAYQRQQDDIAYLDMKQEILLLQALLERRLNAIKCDADVLMSIGPVTQLVQRLESMKSTLLKMQQTLGLVLGKDALRGLAKEIADILDQELDGLDDKYERLERISLAIIGAIESAGKNPENLD